jgi:mannose-6-phosphate isomerase-like protein (cupin superfamily)
MTTPATAVPDSLATVTTVTRAEIRPITSVTVGGTTHQLGQQRDFRRHPALSAFLPDTGRPSFAWVRLRDGEELAVHVHPTSSMILVCRGAVRLLGDTEQLLAEGDVVCVPPGRPHGFRTDPGQEFHGLSVQFEGAGLYEDELTPRVSFGGAADAETPGADARGDDTIAGLERLNDALAGRHARNPLFGLLRGGLLRDDPAMRARFVAALYVWSRHFQRMLHARQAVCVDPDLREHYAEHLSEEYGHDRLLRDRYGVAADVGDPVLEAAATWFVAQMYQLDEAQKIVMVHMVVETSGQLFGAAAAQAFMRDAGEDDYFTLHAEADDGHSRIGRHRLAGMPSSEFPRLRETCRRAWDQMDLIHERIAAWTVEGR